MNFFGDEFQTFRGEKLAVASCSVGCFLGYMQHIDSLPRVRLCVAVYLACLDFLITRTLILGSYVGLESLVSAPPCSTYQGPQVCHSEKVQTAVHKKFIETSIQAGPLCQRRIFHKSAKIKSRHGRRSSVRFPQLMAFLVILPLHVSEIIARPRGVIKLGVGSKGARVEKNKHSRLPLDRN